MAHDARQVANWFVGKFAADSRPLTVMELLKLTYIAHGWHLEMHDSPLFHNRIEAWRHGPVIPDVYYAFKSQRLEVEHQVAGYPAPTDRSVAEFLEDVYNKYGNYEGWHLSSMTHVPGGPWHAAMEIGGPFSLIPDSVIKPHYAEMRKRYESAQPAHENG